MSSHAIFLPKNNRNHIKYDFMKKFIGFLIVVATTACNSNQPYVSRFTSIPDYYRNTRDTLAVIQLENYLSTVVSDDNLSSKTKSFEKIITSDFEIDGAVTHSYIDHAAMVEKNKEDNANYLQFEKDKLYLLTNFPFNLGGTKRLEKLMPLSNPNALLVYVYALKQGETDIAYSQLVSFCSKQKVPYLAINNFANQARSYGYTPKFVYTVNDTVHNKLVAIVDDWDIFANDTHDVSKEQSPSEYSVESKYGFVYLLSEENEFTGGGYAKRNRVYCSSIEQYNSISEDIKYQALDKYQEKFMKSSDRITSPGKIKKRQFYYFDTYAEASKAREKLLND